VINYYRPKRDSEDGKGLKIKRCTGAGLFAYDVGRLLLCWYSVFIQPVQTPIVVLLLKDN
jgi:hypothetical protein